MHEMMKYVALIFSFQIGDRCLAFRMTPENTNTKTAEVINDAVEKVIVQHQKISFLVEDDKTFSSEIPSQHVPLGMSIKTKDDIPPTRYASTRKKWGVDDENINEYWFNNKIHTFGNTGFFGGMHAAVAPLLI
mmetsp:Transcript_42056/g.61696  ORF Transcript_42056/g.61696 Transcript_42056/m.61696 type:complete len:133 (+) Transcript_42056:113-511(+)